MKAIKVLTASVILAANLAIAQTQPTVKFGIKAGANLSTLTGSSVTSNKVQFGAYGGAYSNFFISHKIKLQAEVLYSSQGTKWTTDIPAYLPSVDREIKQNIHLGYLNIPIVVQYEFIRGLYCELGPQFGVLLNAKDENTTTDTDKTIPSSHVITSSSVTTNIKPSLKGTDFSGVIGLGYRLDNGINFNARYNIGFVDIAKAASVQAKNSVFSLGLGYSF